VTLAARITAEARDGDVAAAGCRIAQAQLRADLDNPALTAKQRRHRFDQVIAATRTLLTRTPEEKPVNIPTAESLPFATIVAKRNAAVWVKEEESSRSGKPWAAVHYPGAISDADVDEVLQSGEATVLRVGEGK
jgi:hypothetical protein